MKTNVSLVKNTYKMKKKIASVIKKNTDEMKKVPQ